VVVYSADRAQDVHDENASAKGPTVKLKANSPAVEFIRCHIVIKKWSPEAVAARMKQKGMEDAVCAKTIYNHIDKGEIPGVSNETLWEKRTRGKKHKSLHRRAKRSIPLDRSIDDRPAEVADREEAGHWEIDLVVGGKGLGKAALLTLVERKTRKLIVRKIKDKTQAAVVRAINGIERAMGKEAFKVVFSIHHGGQRQRVPRFRDAGGVRIRQIGKDPHLLRASLFVMGAGKQRKHEPNNPAFHSQGE
jgi:IS30 family transposase